MRTGSFKLPRLLFPEESFISLQDLHPSLSPLQVATGMYKLVHSVSRQVITPLNFPSALWLFSSCMLISLWAFSPSLLSVYRSEPAHGGGELPLGFPHCKFLMVSSMLFTLDSMLHVCELDTLLGVVYMWLHSGKTAERSPEWSTVVCLLWCFLPC